MTLDEPVLKKGGHWKLLYFLPTGTHISRAEIYVEVPLYGLPQT